MVGWQDHEMGVERRRRASGPLAGEGERRDLESRAGDELRKDPVEHVYVIEVPGG